MTFTVVGNVLTIACALVCAGMFRYFHGQMCANPGPHDHWFYAIVFVAYVIRIAVDLWPPYVYLPAATIDGAMAALCAYWWWKIRPRKKSRLSKVLGRVRDLGHRLTIVPEGA